MKAPDFTADAYHMGNKVKIKLADYLKKWVLLFFYPSDFTFVWPTELAAVSRAYHIFVELGVEVFAVCTDSVYSHKVFAEVSPSGRTIQYPLISDRSHQISKAYGVLKEEEGYTHRAIFIISPGGEVQFSCLYPPFVGRNVAEIIRIVQALQFYKSTGLGVPAGWRPGQPGIKRDFARAGRI